MKNYIQQEPPEKFIKIGLKNERVVFVDWFELSMQMFDLTHEETIKLIQKYLREATQFIER